MPATTRKRRRNKCNVIVNTTTRRNLSTNAESKQLFLIFFSFHSRDCISSAGNKDLGKCFDWSLSCSPHQNIEASTRGKYDFAKKSVKVKMDLTGYFSSEVIKFNREPTM